MSEQGESVLLPSAEEEIMDRLRQVRIDALGYIEKEFYTLVAQAAAGRKLNALGVVLMIMFAIHDFVSSGYPPAMTGILYVYVPRLIIALLGNEVHVAGEALQIWYSMRGER